MKTALRQLLAVLPCLTLFAGCATWNAEILNTSQVYPAFPEARQLIGSYTVLYDARDRPDEEGVKLELMSDGTYYESFSAETSQVFIKNTGHWHYEQGHLHLKSDHRALGTMSRTQPVYTVFTTSPQATDRLQLLPASVGAVRGGQLFLHGRPSKGNFFPDRIREGSDTLVQFRRGFPDEPAAQKRREDQLRNTNFWARRSAHTKPR